MREKAQTEELENARKLAVAERARATAEAARAATEQNKAQAIRRWLSLVVCLAVAAVALAMFAWRKSAEADMLAVKAGKQRDIARSEEKKANNAKALAEAAQRESRNLTADIFLQNGTTAIRQESDVPEGTRWYTEALVTFGDDALDSRFAARSLIGGWSRFLPRLSLLDDAVGIVVFSSDSRRIATACGGPGSFEARLWDVQNGQLRNVLKHEGYVFAVAFSPDSRTVATGSGYRLWGEGRLWNAENGELRRTVEHFNNVNSVAFSPDGRSFATASDDNTARLWDVETGQGFGDVPKHEGSVNAVSFSRDGLTVATVSSDRTAKLWDAKTGRQIVDALNNIRTIDTYSPTQTALSISPDFQTLATVARDFDSNHDEVRFWAFQTGEELGGDPLKHDAYIHTLTFSPDGQTLATVDNDKTVRLWDVFTRKPRGSRFTHTGSVNAVTFSPDGKTLVTASDDLTARIWDAQTGQACRMPLQHDARVRAASFSPDGRLLATASGGFVRLYDTPVGQLPSVPLTHDAPVIAVAFSPDGRTLATGSEDGTLRLLDARSGDALNSFKHPENVRSMSFTPDGRTLVTSSGRMIWFLDPRTGQVQGELLKSDNDIKVMAVSPDGRTLATGSAANLAGEVKLWDVPTGQLRCKPLRHNGEVVALSFSPDGRTLATGSRLEARLWDLQTGQPRGKPLIHDSGVVALSFSPDGRTLASGSGSFGEGEARLWDVQAGQLRCEPLRHDSEVVSLSFSPDGSRLATASHDRLVRLWDVPPPVPDDPTRVRLSVEVASWRTIENGLIRRLTEKEWQDRKRQLDELGGDCLKRTWDDLSEAEKRELRTPASIAAVSPARRSDATAAEAGHSGTLQPRPPVASNLPDGGAPRGGANPRAETSQAGNSRTLPRADADTTILWVVAVYAGLVALLAIIAGAARRGTRTKPDRRGDSADANSSNAPNLK